MNRRKNAFTLIELLVVIAIIGVLATVSIVALSNARAKSRDAKRAGDMKQIQTALELFFNDKNRYPTAEEFALGSIFSTSSGATSTYMQIIPSAPTPADGSCTNDQNTVYYQQTENGNSYTISFCLGNTTGALTAGSKCLTPGGIMDVYCGPFVCGDNVTYGGETYPTVLIGSQCWFAKNLDIGSMVVSAGAAPCQEMGSGTDMWSCQLDPNTIEKYCMVNDAGNCSTWGGFYEWAEFMGFPYQCNDADFSSGSSDCGTGVTYTIAATHQGICPDGWHVPSDNDWYVLENGLDSGSCSASRSGWDCDPAATALRPSGGSGFNFLLSGFRAGAGQFIGNGTNTYADVWSTLADTSSNSAMVRGFYAPFGSIARSEFPRVYGLSVRCVMD